VAVLFYLNKGMRTLKFKTVEELENEIERYFDLCDSKTKSVYDNRTKCVVDIDDPDPYTMSGLAYTIGVDRKTLINYKKRELYFPTIKRARRKVEADVEKRSLSTPYQSGCIFNLKNNFDWKDKRETKHSGDFSIANFLDETNKGTSSTTIKQVMENESPVPDSKQGTAEDTVPVK